MDEQALTSLLHFQDEHLWIKPICDFFEIDMQNQTANIRRDPFLANHYEKNSNSLLFGDNYQRILLDRFGFIVWIANINSNTIAEEKREAFKKFQHLIYEFLHGSVKENAEMKALFIERIKLKKEVAIKNDRIKFIDRRFSAFNEKKYLQGELPLDQTDPKQLGESEDSEAN